MWKRLMLILAVLLWGQVAMVQAAHIVVVSENIDGDLDRLEDDYELIDWLVAEGHSVDVRRNTWEHLDDQRITELNAADLIIVSRTTNSGLYMHGSEPTQWNSLTTPLLLMNPYFTRTIRWNWINYDMVTNYTLSIDAEVLDAWPSHLPGRRSDDLGASRHVVQVIDPTVGTGITSFVDTTDVGNGHLIARVAGTDLSWIVEWDAGVEFYNGAGQFAGGKRLLFCAGTQEQGDSRQGEFNLTPEGRHMLRNAIAYLLGGARIILVTEERDSNQDGLRDDLDLEAWLVEEGHFVDVRPDYWRELDSGKLAELNAADLIIFSRATNSASYDDGDETALWNSLAVPLLQMNVYFARNIRWEWINSEAATNDTDFVFLEAIEPSHPIFDDVTLLPLGPGNWSDSALIVQMIDPTIGSGITSFMDAVDMGNGRLLARPALNDMGWIVEWDAGVEFYTGAGQYTSAKRLLFAAGTQEIEFVDLDTQELLTTTQGELNLTADGLQMLRNAIDYLLSSPTIHEWL